MFNLDEFIAQVAQQNQESALTPPPQAPMMDQGMPAQNNAMGGGSPFSQIMGAVQGGGGEDKKGGLFNVIMKMFAGG